MSIATTEIRSLGELIDRVTPADPDPVSGRHRDSGVYRGCVDAQAPLVTALDELGGLDRLHSKAEVEEHVLRNFIRYSRPHFANTLANDWELLIAAQHHGAPTRLLDWSYSPLVAAHFATMGAWEGDRVVWRLEWKVVHGKFGLPPLALLIEDLDRAFGRDKPFTPWRLFNGAGIEPFACLLDPPALDARIETQAAAFTLCSSKTESLDSFLVRHNLESALKKYVIRAADVRRIRDQLDLVGISERRLFPDLDGVAVEIYRYYS